MRTPVAILLGVLTVVWAASEPPVRVMFVCGVHGREYATSLICKQLEKQLANNTFGGRFEWKFVSEANPDGISIATDQGKSCHRGNGRGVDLNRNWPAIRVQSSDMPQELKTWEVNPGENPFSEAETRHLKDEIERFQPGLLLEFHTGACAMLSPYQSLFVPPDNHKEHQQFSGWLLYERMGFDRHECKRGAGLTTLYPATGTMMDYAYEALEVPMVFVVETYEPKDYSLRSLSTANLTDAQCKSYFVPEDLEQYTHKWAGGIANGLTTLSEKEYKLLQKWTRPVRPAGSRAQRVPEL